MIAIEYHNEQLRLYNVVRQSEQLVFDCGKGKFIFNEVKQELRCGCGKRIKVAN